MDDFLPIDGNSKEWLSQLYQKYILRSKATGKDGVTHAKFHADFDKEIDLIHSRIDSKTYRFTKYREVLLSRGHSKIPRQLSVPTIRDRLTIRATLQHLKQVFPEALLPPPHRFIKDIKKFLESKTSAVFLRMDICDFYPSIDHNYLISILKSRSFDDRFLALIQQAITTPTGDAEISPLKGIPQGLAISNILASLYMLEFDKIADSEIFYKRYVDDILVIASDEEISEIHPALDAGLGNLSLNSHPMGTPGKTEIVDAKLGVQYLGYEVAIGRTSIRSESLARMFTNLAKVVTSLRRGKNTRKDLYRLNLKITGCVINNARRGWLMFFSQTDDLAQLSFLDRWLLKEIAQIKSVNDISPRSFRKSYYEIRYNLAETDYIPNFDKYSFEQKAEVVSILSNRSPEQIAAMDLDVLDRDLPYILTHTAHIVSMNVNKCIPLIHNTDNMDSNNPSNL